MCNALNPFQCPATAFNSHKKSTPRPFPCIVLVALFFPVCFTYSLPNRTKWNTNLSYQWIWIKQSRSFNIEGQIKSILREGTKIYLAEDIVHGSFIFWIIILHHSGVKDETDECITHLWPISIIWIKISIAASIAQFGLFNLCLILTPFTFVNL